MAVNPFNGNEVYVAWSDSRYGTGGSDVLFVKSTDGGTTWTSPINVANNLAAGYVNDQFFPWMSVDPGGRINISFYDRRDDPNNVYANVYIAQSVDHGGTFLSNVKVTDMAFNLASDSTWGGSFIGDYTGIATSSKYAYPLWTDTRNTNQDIYTYPIDVLTYYANQNKSTTYSASGNNNDHVLERGTIDGKLNEVFASGGEIFYRRSSDNGSTWYITTRLSTGNGSNQNPSIVAGYGSPNDMLRAVWQRQLDGTHYEIWNAYSTNGGSTWSTPLIVDGASYVTVSSTQSPGGGGPGPTPVIGTFYYPGNEMTASYLLVYAAQEGFHYRTLPYTTAPNWTIPSPDIVPGSEGYFNGDFWTCYNWYPCLASYDNQGYRVNLIYDDRSTNVYSQIFDEGNGVGWGSRTAIGWTGSYRRYSSVALDPSNNALGVWTSWNGSHYVIDFSQGNANNSWGSWTHEWPVYTNNSFLPAVTYYNKGGGFPYGVDVNWYTDTKQVWHSKWDGGEEGIWYSYQLSSNGMFANTTHERSSSGVPKHIWTDQSTAPYAMILNSQNLPKSAAGGLASDDLHRAAVIADAANNSQLKVELSEPVITTSSGQQQTVPFKEYDYTAKLALTTSNIFDYLQTEPVTIPPDASDISYTLSITASQPDTLPSGKLNPVKQTGFTSIDAEELAKENGASLLSSGVTSLRDAKGLLSQTKTISLPITSFQGKTISFVPHVNVAGTFDEKNLHFSLVNFLHRQSGGSATGTCECSCHAGR
ncbi:MAG: exo-alpha-sialidase [Bacteroidota bacterium]|nr:exo-alpha-sialidase [Bacteroidota bacterium]